MKKECNVKESTQFYCPLGEGVREGNIRGSLTPALCKEADLNPQLQTTRQISLP